MKQAASEITNRCVIIPIVYDINLQLERHPSSIRGSHLLGGSHPESSCLVVSSEPPNSHENRIPTTTLTGRVIGHISRSLSVPMNSPIGNSYRENHSRQASATAKWALTRSRNPVSVVSVGSGWADRVLATVGKDISTGREDRALFEMRHTSATDLHRSPAQNIGGLWNGPHATRGRHQPPAGAAASPARTGVSGLTASRLKRSHLYRPPLRCDICSVRLPAALRLCHDRILLHADVMNR